MNKNLAKKNIFLPDIPINEESKDKLFSLVSSHNLSELEEFITTDSISLNVKNNNNESIIHILLKGESPTDEEELLRCIKFLVERGAPISSIDNENLTPLFICIKKKYSKIFKFLLDKGASLDINTNDDLTVLHVLSQPEYTTYNAKGIQELIPEKLPKITMEGYEQVYKDIVNKIDPNKLNIFKTIAKQFYYHDEREDFNNSLLIEEASKNPNIKNELFLKLKNQLKDFYTSNRIKDIDIQNLNNKLINIKNELNNEFAQNNMIQFNNNLSNAIEYISFSLQLSISFKNLFTFSNNNYLNLCKQYKLLKNNNPIIIENNFINTVKLYDLSKYLVQLDKKFVDYAQKEEIKNIFDIDNTNIYNTINYFNLLHTFNVKAGTYLPPNKDIQDVIKLYQNIQEIYKYNYIIYIFEKEREKILNLKNKIINNDFQLKKHLDNLFDTTFKELENSVNLIKEQLKKIEKLSNEYIDVNNKINGYYIYSSDINPIYIGVYPQIHFPTEIKYTSNEEDKIIIECDKNYNIYNQYKNDFFHNFVLYFQDIGHYTPPPAPPVPPAPPGQPIILFDNIINSKDYNINISNFNINIIPNDDNINQDTKNKAYKLYFYDPIYLKLEKEKIVKDLSDNIINNISISKFNKYNNEIKEKLNIEIKNNILNEILENKFNEILVLEINNYFKNKLSNKTEDLLYEINIKELDLNAMLLASIGFSNILIPNYEFKNNKFISISKNKFLKLRLYFDTNYFKPTIFNELKYYKENKFIKELLLKNKSLLLKTDIKGWTPIYYAIDGNNFQVTEEILKINEIDTLIHYDHKHISPLKICINKQLHHLNYLLTDNNKIHYLNNYIKMLKNELESNNILIPLNIESVFIISLFIQNHIWLENANDVDLKILNPKNTRKEQINKEYNYIDTKTLDVNNKKFNYNDENITNKIDKTHITYRIQQNNNYNNIDNSHNIFKKYYDKANELEKKDMGLYGSYWKKYNNIQLLEHINISKKLKDILEKYKEVNDKKFNLPIYNISELKTDLTNKLTPIKKILEHYLEFINIRFNTNKQNAYNVTLNRIFVHVLANIIGVDFYFKMEELIVKHYMNLNIDINTDSLKELLKKLNKLLINNKLDDTNINYKYISTGKNRELVLKNDIIEILNTNFFPENKELIDTFETKVYPNYKDLYKITFKYLQMFISNYHKFIYNQYHGLEILLLLLDKISS